MRTFETIVANHATGEVRSFSRYSDATRFVETSTSKWEIVYSGSHLAPRAKRNILPDYFPSVAEINERREIADMDC